MSKLTIPTALLLVGLLAILFSVSRVIAQEDDTLAELAPAPTPTPTPSIDWAAIELPPHDLPAAEENRGPVPDEPEPTREPVSGVNEEPTLAADVAAATEPPPHSTPQPALPAVPVIIGRDPGSYFVRRGDTLFRIALAYGVNPSALATFNHLTNPNLIYPGQQLEIPPTGDAVTVLLNSTPAAATPHHRYTVPGNETLEQIARRFGVSVQEIAAANTLKTITYISPGTSLTIPGRDDDAAALQATPSPTSVPIATPVLVPTQATPLPTAIPTPQPTAALVTAGATNHTVQSGDTLQTIARRYGVTVEALALFNQLGNWWLIYPGQVLTIPSANDPIPTRTPYPEGTPYLWPVESRAIIKGYQYGHAAIDIVVDTGTPVVAMADGVVEFAGWNNYGYGWLIVVNHSDGVSTLYAHHDTLVVETGQAVKQGEVIGYSGNTGNSTMPHLHLEFRINLGAVNPCSYLLDGC